MSKFLNTELYLATVDAEHRAKHDYSKTVYVNAKTKIEIVCPKHSSFWQMPTSHRSGCGCPTCAAEEASLSQLGTAADFKDKVDNFWGLEYDYSIADYKGYHKHLTVICHKHGPFSVTPANHLKGRGCPCCGLLKRAESRLRGREDILKQVADTHRNFYDYSEAVFRSVTDKVTIKCPVHGPFEQVMSGHIRGKGCHKCAIERNSENRKSNTLEFVYKAVAKKGNLYDYSLAEYVDNETPVEIICKEHGSFWQSPANHLAGQGCPSCAETGYNSSKAGFLYILESGDITKVGITNVSPKRRASQVSNSAKMKFKVLKYYQFSDGRIPRSIERKALAWLRINYLPVSQCFHGSTECFIEVDKARLVNFVQNEVPQITTQLPKELQ